MCSFLSAWRVSLSSAMFPLKKASSLAICTSYGVMVLSKRIHTFHVPRLNNFTFFFDCWVGSSGQLRCAGQMWYEVKQIIFREPFLSSSSVERNKINPKELCSDTLPNSTAAVFQIERDSMPWVACVQLSVYLHLLLCHLLFTDLVYLGEIVSCVWVGLKLRCRRSHSFLSLSGYNDKKETKRLEIVPVAKNSQPSYVAHCALFIFQWPFWGVTFLNCWTN